MDQSTPHSLKFTKDKLNKGVTGDLPRYEQRIRTEQAGATSPLCNLEHEQRLRNLGMNIEPQIFKASTSSVFL